MTKPKNPIVLIPLADINGKPMIIHVLDRALESGIERVVVVCGDRRIMDIVRQAGGEAVLTDPAIPSGSDRIFAGLKQIDPYGKHDAVINIQGDLPILEKHTVIAAYQLLDRAEVHIGTVASEIRQEAEKTNPSVVKAVVAWEPDGFRGRGLYFTRSTAPNGIGPLFHHIGIYAFRRHALERFVSLPQSLLEKQENLEQLRALENGMRIDVARVDTIPFGVDTPADLKRARYLLKL